MAFQKKRMIGRRARAPARMVGATRRLRSRHMVGMAYDRVWARTPWARLRGRRARATPPQRSGGHTDDRAGPSGVKFVCALAIDRLHMVSSPHDVRP